MSSSSREEPPKMVTFVVSSASCLSNECNPVFPDRPRLSSPIQPPGEPRSSDLNPHSLLNWDPPAQVWRGVPPLFTTVPGYGTDSSPLLAGFNRRMDLESPRERELFPDCVLGEVLSSGSHRILPPGTAPRATWLVHITPPHLKGSPRTASGESEISCPSMELKFAPFTGPPRLFAAI